MEAFYAWLEASWLGQLMIQNPLAFTAAETLHFMGLTVLIGTLLVVDLRGMGVLKRIPLVQAHKLIPFTIGAFAINLLTGIAFIASNPSNYFSNTAFQLKALLIVLAGINAVIFELAVFRPLLAGKPGIEEGAVVRITSFLSLVFWAGVLIFGRLIPYF